VTKSVILALTVLIACAAYAQERKNACTKYDETHLQACASGRDPVWAYDVKGPDTNGQIVQSTGYRTAQAAEQDRDAAKKLCDTVDRYFDHTSCRTTYGTPYCAACGTGASREGSLQPEQEVNLEKAHLVLDRWRSQVVSATRTMLRDNPSANPLRNTGKVLRDYTAALRDATKDAIRLQRVLQNGSGGVNTLSADLQPAIDALQNDISGIQTVQRDYEQSLQSQPPDPGSSNAPGSGCVSAAYDGAYHWLQLHDNCGQPVYVTLIFTSGKYQVAADIGTGRAADTGLSRQDVDSYGGHYELLVCPKGSVPVDGRGRLVDWQTFSNFTCKHL